MTEKKTGRHDITMWSWTATRGISDEVLRQMAILSAFRSGVLQDAFRSIKTPPTLHFQCAPQVLVTDVKDFSFSGLLKYL